MIRSLFILVLAGIGLSPFSTRAFAQDQSYWSCGREGGEATVRIAGSFVLQQTFFSALKTASGNEAMEAAISQELRYAQGYFINTESISESLVLDLTQAPVIESIKTTEKPYPLTLSVDPVNHPDVKISDPYILAALKRGKTKAGDPGLRVDFKVLVHAMVCSGDRNRVVRDIKLNLPTDPYLAYWLVSRVNRKQIHWHKSEFVINPCADRELADIPDPFYYWYFWDAQAKGKDVKGSEFTCSELLKKGKELTGISAEIVQLNPVAKKNRQFDLTRFGDRQPLRISALFGATDPKGERVDYLKLLTSIQAKSPENLEKVLDLIPVPQSEVIDPGSMNLRRFLSELNRRLDSSGIKISSNPSDGVVLVEGKFATTQRAVQIRIFYGDTDVLTTASPLYWRNLASALAKDDVVLYSGHSGLGENMKLSQIMSNTGKSEAELFGNSPPHQLIGIFSCFSYSYFGDELAQARSKYSNRSTDLIRTASAFEDAIGHIVVLNELDNREPASGYRPWDLVVTTSYPTAQGTLNVVKGY